MKIVFLNDLHPHSSPGAASVAYSLAQEASKYHEVEFWCSEVYGRFFPKDPRIETRIRFISKERVRKMEGRFLQRLYFELFGIFESLWVIKQIVVSRPTHIWFHQIGNRFPKVLIPISRIFGVATVVTLHDFSVLLGRKLYPSDFGLSSESVGTQINHLQLQQVRILRGNKLQDILLRLRTVLVKRFLNFSSLVIGISDLQETILKTAGFRIDAVIQNGLLPCTCTNASRKSDGKFNILFAGRPNAKGLELLAQAVAEAPNSHLHLAGPQRLVEIAECYLRSNQYTFHGKLNSIQMNQLIHSVDLVSVISQCFDVYPTITLEAIAHKTPVLTTPLTGNSFLVRSLSPSLVIGFNQKPDLSKITSVVGQKPLKFPITSTVAESWKLYEKFLIQIS